MSILEKTVIDYINDAQTIYIATHVRPDGDAIGSANALCLALKGLGKKVKVIMPSYSSRFAFLQTLSEVIERVPEEEYDLLICTDCSDLNRVNILPEDIEKAKYLVVFDHHKFSSINADAAIIDEKSPAACEMVYKFFKENNINITSEIASLLYMGIMTDTGSFNYDRTTADTYRIASELVSLGADFATICKKINDTVKESKAKLIAYTLQNMEVYFDGQVRMAVVTKEILDKFKIDMEDAEGMTNYLRMIEGTLLAVYIREEEDGKFKVSLRSEGNVDSAVIASSFGGGGHIKAAGFDTYDVENTKKQIIAKMEEVLNFESNRNT